MKWNETRPQKRGIRSMCQSIMLGMQHTLIAQKYRIVKSATTIASDNHKAMYHK